MGAGQALGKLSGRPEFEAAKPSDLVQALGGDPENVLQTLGAGILTDPLTYAGIGGGAKTAANVAERAAWGKMAPISQGLVKMGPGEALPAVVKEGMAARQFGGIPEEARGLSSALGGKAAEMTPGELETLMNQRFPPVTQKPWSEPYQAYLGQNRNLRGTLNPINDFEQEIIQGRRMDPRDLLNTRLGLWDDALGELPISREPNVPRSYYDIPKGGILTPDEMRMVQMRRMQMVGERGLTPYLQGLSDTEANELWSKLQNQLLHGQSDPRNYGPDIIDRLTRAFHGNYGTIHDRLIPGYEQYAQIANEAFPLYDQPFLRFHAADPLTVSRLSDAGEILATPHPTGLDNPIDLLRRMGYALDRDKLLKFARDAQAWHSGPRYGELFGQMVEGSRELGR
jgi:hypothetical protein